MNWSTQMPNAVGIAAAATCPRASATRAGRGRRRRRRRSRRRRRAEGPASRRRAVEERECRHEDAEEQREAAEPRHRALVRAGAARGGRRRRARAPPPTAGVRQHDRSAIDGPVERPRGCRAARPASASLLRAVQAVACVAEAWNDVARSFKPWSIDATTMDTSGWSRWIRAIPSGAAISAISAHRRGARRLQPHRRGVELPVASIGSSRITSRSAMSFGSFT